MYSDLRTTAETGNEKSNCMPSVAYIGFHSSLHRLRPSLYRLKKQSKPSLYRLKNSQNLACTGSKTVKTACTGFFETKIKYDKIVFDFSFLKSNTKILYLILVF